MRGALDWIVMKCLEKDRTRRYETASGLAADVRRYLDDQPVEAGPPSAWYRCRKFASRNRKGLATVALSAVSGLIVVLVLGAVYLQDVSRIRQVTQDVRQALAGARTAIDARDLTLAGQRVAEAQGRLGADEASLRDLAAEIGGLRREIDARQADAARFDQFLNGASDGQDKMSSGKDSGGDRVAEGTLALFGILTEKDWLSRLENSYLTADQKQQVRETAYVTLVSLADFLVRWAGSDPKSVARSLDLLQRAQGFRQPTRAFFFVRAECRRRQGDTAAADEDEKQFQAAVARTAWDYYLPGHTAGWRGDLAEAIRSYQAALRLQPNHYNSLFFLAMRLSTEKIHRPAEAIAYFTGCIALRPDHAAAYRNRGICHQALGHLDAAEADFATAFTLAKNDVGRGLALHAQAAAMSAKGKYQEAQELWRRVIPMVAEANLLDGDPYAETLNDLAWSLATCPDPQFRDPAQAVELARKAIEKAPRANKWNTLGVALYRAGHWKAAIEAIEKSEALEPDKSLAFNGFFLAMARWRIGQSDEARTWYDRSLTWMERKAPRNPELIRFRAEAAALLGVDDLPSDVFAGP